MRLRSRFTIPRSSNCDCTPLTCNTRAELKRVHYSSWKVLLRVWPLHPGARLSSGVLISRSSHRLKPKRPTTTVCGRDASFLCLRMTGHSEHLSSRDFVKML